MVGALAQRLLVASFSLACLVAGAEVVPAEGVLNPAPTPPLTVGSWTRPAEVRRIEPAGIFDYMDGGGELYLAYRFDHLDVYEYAPRETGEDAILVDYQDYHQEYECRVCSTHRILEQR